MHVAAVPPLRLEPSLEEARELAREGNVVPVRARFLDDCETPVSAFLKLRAGEPEGAPCFLLESAGEPPRRPEPAPDPYAAVAARLGELTPAPVPDLPPFAGGAVGFFGYDL